MESSLMAQSCLPVRLVQCKKHVCGTALVRNAGGMSRAVLLVLSPMNKEGVERRPGGRGCNGVLGRMEEGAGLAQEGAGGGSLLCILNPFPGLETLQWGFLDLR